MARVFIGAVMGAVLYTAIGSAPAAWADEEEGVEKAATSKLADVTLPQGAFRSTVWGDVAKFEVVLSKAAEANHGRIAQCEVLVWQGGNKVMKQMGARLKDAGYTYVVKESFEAEAGKITPIAAVRKEKKSELLGMWIETGGNTLLAWGLYKPLNPVKPGSAPEAGAAVESETAQKPESAADSKPPTKGESSSSLLGTWSWTTISSVGYQDTITKQLAAPSGMSARFTFSKEGKYTKFFYVRQRTYSLVTESTTTEEGAYVDHGDGTVTLKPAKGHYKGSTGARIIDRPMTDSERKPAVWHYEWRTDDGKRKLYFGPGKTSLSPFKPAE